MAPLKQFNQISVILSPKINSEILFFILNDVESKRSSLKSNPNLKSQNFYISTKKSKELPPSGRNFFAWIFFQDSLDMKELNLWFGMFPDSLEKSQKLQFPFGAKSSGNSRLWWCMMT